MQAIGEILGYGGSSMPRNFLLCDGSAVSRTTYSSLFAVIGTSFGVGDGSTTFNLPDFRGKIAAGYNSGDSNFNSIGKTGGNETANLQHSHTQNSHTHSVSGNTGSPSATQQVYGGSGNVSDNTHTHSFSLTSGGASDSGTNNQLSSSQSVLNPYNTINFIIRYNKTKADTFWFFTQAMQG